MTQPPEPPPKEEDDHIEAGVQRMAQLQAEYTQDITALQRRVSAAAKLLARPGVAVAAMVIVAVWLTINALPFTLALRFDPPPFPLLQTLGSVVALVTTLLILSTQRKDEELTRRNALLTLQLASLSEQKIAKVIDLLEEQRRENPLLPAREDSEAEAMASPSDPAHVLGRIIDTHDVKSSET